MKISISLSRTSAVGDESIESFNDFADDSGGGRAVHGQDRSNAADEDVRYSCVEFF